MFWLFPELCNSKGLIPYSKSLVEILKLIKLSLDHWKMPHGGTWRTLQSVFCIYSSLFTSAVNPTANFSQNENEKYLPKTSSSSSRYENEGPVYIDS